MFFEVNTNTNSNTCRISFSIPIPILGNLGFSIPIPILAKTPIPQYQYQVLSVSGVYESCYWAERKAGTIKNNKLFLRAKVKSASKNQVGDGEVGNKNQKFSLYAVSILKKELQSFKHIMTWQLASVFTGFPTGRSTG